MVGNKPKINLVRTEIFFNDCAKTKKLSSKLIKELNDLDNAPKNKIFLDTTFYSYYSKYIKAKKSGNKGIRLIKQYIFIAG